MKKTLLALIFVLSFLTAKAQDSKFELGPELGINLSNYAISDPMYANNPLIRTSFGVLTKVKFSEAWGMRLKLKYDGKGSKAKDGSFKERLDYLTIPVMAEWGTDFNDLRLFISGGPYVGFLLSGTLEQGNEEMDIKNEISSPDAGVATGVGLLYKVQDNMRVMVELGNQIGVLDIGAKNDSFYIRNSVSSINFGILFGL